MVVERGTHPRKSALWLIGINTKYKSLPIDLGYSRTQFYIMKICTLSCLSAMGMLSLTVAPREPLFCQSLETKISHISTDYDHRGNVSTHLLQHRNHRTIEPKRSVENYPNSVSINEYKTSSFSTEPLFFNV